MMYALRSTAFPAAHPSSIDWAASDTDGIELRNSDD
jgi:hypothetical protein